MTGRIALLRWEYGVGRRHAALGLGYAGLVVALYLAVPAAGTGTDPSIGALALGSYLLVANAAFSWTGEELTTVTAWAVALIAGYVLVLPIYWGLLGPDRFDTLASLPGGRASIAVIAATCVTAVTVFPVASYKQFGRDADRGEGPSVEEDVLSEEELEEFDPDDGFDWRGSPGD